MTRLQQAAIPKQFDLVVTGWAHFLCLFKLFSDINNYKKNLFEKKPQKPHPFQKLDTRLYFMGYPWTLSPAGGSPVELLLPPWIPHAVWACLPPIILPWLIELRSRIVCLIGLRLHASQLHPGQLNPGQLHPGQLHPGRASVHPGHVRLRVKQLSREN
jgi:hypothetical protein